MRPPASPEGVCADPAQVGRQHRPVTATANDPTAFCLLVSLVSCPPSLEGTSMRQAASARGRGLSKSDRRPSWTVTSTAGVRPVVKRGRPLLLGLFPAETVFGDLKGWLHCLLQRTRKRGAGGRTEMLRSHTNSFLQLNSFLEG